MDAILIRHATSSGQAADAPLADAGYMQAEALVPVLTALNAGPLYASPYTRAQETIAPYAKESRQEVTILDDLRERLLSPVALPDWQDHIRRSFFHATHAAPGGESHTHMFLRAGRAFAHIVQAGGPLPTFVTHGGLTSCLFNRVDPSFGFEDWQALRNPDLFHITLASNRITSFQRQPLEVQT